LILLKFSQLTLEGSFLEGEETYLSLPDRIRKLKKNGRYSEAEGMIQKELEKNPDQLFLKASLADLYLRQGRLADGRILVEEVLARDPGHPQALCVLGDIFFKERSFREALDCYRQASSRESGDYPILKAARALKEMKRFGEALEELEKVLVVNPQSFSFLKEKALILNRMKKFDRALEIYEKIEEISPQDAFVHKEILRLRSRAHPDPQVLQEFRAVVGMESKKDDPQMHGLLAQKLKKAGMVKEAAEEYKTAFHLDPKNLYFLKQQGFCHYREKKYPEAIQCLQEAFRKDPADSVVRDNLERSYEAQGDLATFLKLLEETLMRYPNQKPLLGVIKRVRKKLGRPSSGDS